MESQEGLDEPVGIDAGTTRMCVCYKDQIVSVFYGESTFASEVAVRDDRLFLPTQNVTANVVKRWKRLIGRRKDDGLLEEDTKDVHLAKIGNKGAVYNVNGTILDPEEVAAFLIAKCRLAVETRAKDKDKLRYFIGVPAYFTFDQRQALCAAAIIAGIEDPHLIDEPIAALVDFLVNHKDHDLDDKTVVVADPGGGTVDVAAVYVTRTPAGWKLLIMATAGDNRTGGVDVDRGMAEFVLREAGELPFQHSVRALLAECETAKRELSTSDTVLVEIRSSDMNDERSKSVVVSKEDFTDICKPIQAALNASFKHLSAVPTMDLRHVHTVLLTGGTSALPCVAKECEQWFPEAIIAQSNGPETVARGAAIAASTCPNIEIIQTLPRALGIEAHEGPSFDGPLKMHTILHRSAQLPNQRSRDFITTEDDQEEIDIGLFEGDHEDVARNIPLSSMLVKGVPPGKKGQAIVVTIDVRKLGKIKATAKVAGTTQTLVVRPKPWLRKEMLTTLRRLNDDRLRGKSSSAKVDTSMEPFEENTDSAEEGSTEDEEFTATPAASAASSEPSLLPDDILATTPAGDSATPDSSHPPKRLKRRRRNHYFQPRKKKSKTKTS